MDPLRVWETTARVSVYHNNGGMANLCGTALSAVSGVRSGRWRVRRCVSLCVKEIVDNR